MGNTTTRKSNTKQEKNWKELTPKGENLPTARSLHTSCFFKKKNYIITFGGRINHSEGEIIFNDTHIFNYETNEFREIIPILIDTIPSPRYGHTACVYQDQMIIYGGTSKTKVFSEIWKYDFDTEEWLEVKNLNSKFKPKGRFNHSCCLYDNHLVIFGGSSKSRHFNNLLFFDLTNSTWKEKKCFLKPPKMEGHSSCIFENSMYIFGGHSIVQEFNHLFKFNFLNETWNEISIIGSIPKERAFHSGCVYNSSMFILGDVDLQDSFLYEFDFHLNIWKIKDLDSPKIAYHSSVIIDDLNQMVLFGGESNWNQSQNKMFIYQFKNENFQFHQFKSSLSNSLFMDVIFNF
eukprot:gene12481-6229_t